MAVVLVVMIVVRWLACGRRKRSRTLCGKLFRGLMFPQKKGGVLSPKCSPPDLDRTCTGLAPELFQAGRGKCDLTGVVYPREREVGKRMLMCNV